MGGLLAGQAIVNTASEVAKKNVDPPILLRQYEKNWLSIFRDEFMNLLLVRRLFERLDNKAIDDLVSAVSPEVLEEASGQTDFDFHSTAIAKILGAKATAKMAKALLGNEVRRFFTDRS
jgi:flavin-dependent dehydrogenase